MKKIFLALLLLLSFGIASHASAQTTHPTGPINSTSQLSTECLNTPTTCNQYENAFLDGQQSAQSNINAIQLPINQQGLKAGATQVLPPVSNTNTQNTTINATAAGCPNGGTLNNRGACDLGYTPLEPVPGITPTEMSLPALLKNMFNILITLGALFSVTMITLSGVRYMFTDIVSEKGRARERIVSALYGFALIAASWLILHTINPQLTTFTLIPGTGTVTPLNQNIFTPQQPNVGTLTNAQIQSAQSSGLFAGQVANIPNNSFTFNAGAAGNTSLNSDFTTFYNNCTNAKGSVQSVASEVGGQAAMVCTAR